MPRASTRSARIEARIAPETLAVVKRAAELQGRSISEFMVSAAREAAMREVEAAHVIRLSLEDQRAIAAALLDPPEPNESLRRAAANHRKLIGPAT